MSTSSSAGAVAAPAPAPTADDRLQRDPLLRRLLLRPELGSIAGAILVFAGFALAAPAFTTRAGIANFLDPSATLGIMAVAVALLMIGGEFDLSAGVMTGTTGLVTALAVTQLDMNIWFAMLVSLAFAVAIGLANGLLVHTTKLPSFIITLGTFFMLAGLNYGVTKAIINQVTVSGLRRYAGYDSAQTLLASTFGGFQISLLWWILATAVATWVLLRTSVGNWIFAVGGNSDAARSLGVPVRRVRVGLFVTTATAAWFVGQMTAVRYAGATVTTGIGQEFVFIIAAVIGGCLLTGGAGSAVGAAVGALIFGMVSQGMPLAGMDSDLFRFFLGSILLIAVLVNLFVKKRATEARR